MKPSKPKSIKKIVHFNGKNAHPPDYFGEAALRIWNDSLPLLIEKKIIKSELDYPNFEIYCVQHDYLAQAKEELKKGVVIDIINNRGNAMSIKNPACTFYSETFDRILKMGREFGMMPLARSKTKLFEEKSLSTGDSNIEKLTLLRAIK